MDTIYYIIIGAFIFLIIVGLAIVNFSYDEFKRVYNEENRHACGFISTLGLVEMMAQRLRTRFNVNISPYPHSDSYSPYKNTVTVSNDIADSNTLAGLTVIAHELGHAQQCKENPKKMKKYFRKVQSCELLSKLCLPCLIAFIIMIILLDNDLKFYSYIVLALSVLFFVLSLSLKLSTVKIEKEASDNAIEILRDLADFDEQQLQRSKLLLKCAKNTYVADFLKSLLKWTMLTRR